LTPISIDKARELYEHELTEYEVPYEEAFPDVEIEEA
jgi:hypothetical protein